MKKIVAVLLLFIGFNIAFTDQLKAQPAPQPYAGGEIHVDYIGVNPANCNLPRIFQFTLRLYRDCVPSPWENTLQLILRLEQPTYINGAPGAVNYFLIPATFLEDIPMLDNRCIAGQPVCTEGRIYQTTTPIAIPEFTIDPTQNLQIRPKAQIWYGAPAFQPFTTNIIGVDGARDQSPFNGNMELGEEFALYAEFTNMVQLCGDVTGVNANSGQTVTRSLKGYDNQAARWLFPHPLETFCDGVDYEYRLRLDNESVTVDLDNSNAITTDTREFEDSLSFRLVPSFEGQADAVDYAPGFSAYVPFPTVKPVLFDEKKGLLNFTPQLLPNEQTFIGAISFEVLEWKRLPTVDLGGFIRMEYTLVNVTRRQMRFVIDKNCAKRLPEFESVDGVFNVSRQRWEYECSTDEMIWQMTEPMLAEDLVDNTFRIWRGTPDFPTEPIQPYGLKIEALDVKATGEFTRFRIELDRPMGPGEYTMFAKKTVKETTLNNICGFSLPEEEDIPIYVNTASDYDFPQDLLQLCYPAEFPTHIKTNKTNVFNGQTDNKIAKYAYSTWHFTQNPPDDRDTVWADDSKYNMELETDINGDIVYPGGLGENGGAFWEIEYAEDFSWVDYNGVVQDVPSGPGQTVCIASDRVFIQFFEAPEFDLPDIDLCPEEIDWPIIDVQDLVTSTGAIDLVWAYYNEKSGKPITDPAGWDTTGGSTDRIASNMATNHPFYVGSIAEGLNSEYIFALTVILPNGCEPIDTFRVSRNEVKVKIVPSKDTILCPGQTLELENIESRSYFEPERMITQWYLDGEPIIDAIDSVFTVTEEGIYRVEVIKQSSGGFTCMEEDEIRIRYADVLLPPEPVCLNVKWNTMIDSIEQLFFVSRPEGAEDIEVKEKQFEAPEGNWRGLSEESGTGHITIGAQVRIRARGVNLEVPEDAVCRYGPASTLAAACNIAVKPLNVFTPNGDGINDFLYYDLLQAFPGSSLKIFNRWGRLVYESADYRNDWDGDDHKDGTYFWVLDVNDESQGVLKGTVTIIR